MYCVSLRPPIVNRCTNPSAHKQAALYVIRAPYIVTSHLKILIPVGTAMVIVADVKYAGVSTFVPTVNMWCARSVSFVTINSISKWARYPTTSLNDI